MTSDPIRSQSDDIVTHPGPFAAHWKGVGVVGEGQYRKVHVCVLGVEGYIKAHTVLSSGNVSDGLVQPSIAVCAF